MIRLSLLLAGSAVAAWRGFDHFGSDHYFPFFQADVTDIEFPHD